GNIRDPQAKAAGARIEIERARLEDRAGLRIVEIGEGNEVEEQPMQVAMVTRELLQVIEAAGLGLEILVGSDEIGQLPARRRGEDGANAFQSEARHGQLGFA